MFIGEMSEYKFIYFNKQTSEISKLVVHHGFSNLGIKAGIFAR